MTDCGIVGAGPAGVMLGLLLARQGVAVTVLEAHLDFERDFRGDTVHPSTLELMDQLGLIDRLLEIPHGTIGEVPLHTRVGVVPFGGLPPTRLIKSKYPYSLHMPQARFLELVTSEALRHPSFRLIMGARVEGLIESDGRMRGVRYRTPDQDCHSELRADLTVGADGRFSRVRQLAGFAPVGVAQPIDYLWFRLPHLATDPADARGIYVGGGHVMVLLDRGLEWQINYWLTKGSYQRLRAAGMADLGRCIADLAPWLGDRVDQLQDWNQTALLTVEASRVRCWHRPGLLLIGDAAHVMAPAGGVGINVAIQDAVASANILGPKLRRKGVQPRDLAAVQRRREWPTRLVQYVQAMTQWQMLVAGEFDTRQIRVPFVWRLARRIPHLRALRARVVAYGGVWPERIKS